MEDTPLRDARFLLAYAIPLAQKEQFMNFVKEGQRTVDGEFVQDEKGNDISGVIAWLRSQVLLGTRIYTAEIRAAESNGTLAGDALLFIATEDTRREPAIPQADWFGISGFAKRFGKNTKMFLNDELNDLITESAQPLDEGEA